MGMRQILLTVLDRFNLAKYLVKPIQMGIQLSELSSSILAHLTHARAFPYSQ
jgi:hypothetical protein